MTHNTIAWIPPAMLMPTVISNALGVTITIMMLERWQLPVEWPTDCVPDVTACGVNDGDG